MESRPSRDVVRDPQNITDLKFFADPDSVWCEALRYIDDLTERLNDSEQRLSAAEYEAAMMANIIDVLLTEEQIAAKNPVLHSDAMLTYLAYHLREFA